MTALEQPLRAPWRVEQSDCMHFLGSLPDGSVDVVTTDPAYSGMNQHMSFGRGRIVGRYGDAGQPALVHRVPRRPGHLPGASCASATA